MADRIPSLLASYAYLKGFLAKRDGMRFDTWALDSGAFTAHNSKKEVDLDAYCQTITSLRATDARLSDVFALDVIGNAEGTLANAERMKAAGVDAIPTFHFGSDFKYLEAMASYEKIGLGGLAARIEGTNHGQRLSKSQKHNWIKRCFQRVWPKRIHGFGCTDPDILDAFPFESVDSTSWALQPSRYGLWKAYGTLKSVRGKAVQAGLRGQIRHILDIEARIRARWSAVHRAHNVRPFVYRFVVSGGECRHFAKEERVCQESSKAS